MSESPFDQLLIVSAIAFFVPIVTSRIRGRVVPAVVGEIFAGIAVGASGLGLVGHSEILDFLAEFGFAYLMFLSGLEVDLSLLTAPGRQGSRRGVRFASSPSGMAILIYASTIAISLGGVTLLHVLGIAPDVWLTTLILSTTSIGLVVPTLKERGLTSKPFGQTVMAAAFVADFVTLVLIGVFAAIKREGVNAELVLVLALPLAFLVVWRTSRALGDRRIVARTMEELGHATSQLQVRGSLALMLAFVVLAENTGSELILGSFVAGVIVSLLSPAEGASIRVKMDAMGYGFFIPIFFISVGANLDIGAVGLSWESLLLLPAFIVIAFVSKVIPAQLFRLRFSGREATAAGFLLSARLSLIIAASLIGLELGIITPGVNAIIILVAVVMSSLSPIVFARLIGEAKGQVPTVIVVGAGETGRSLASRLESHGARVTLIEPDSDMAQAIPGQIPGLVVGRGTDSRVLRLAGIESATTFVAVTPDDDYNLACCVAARDVFGVPNLVVRLNDPANMLPFREAGIRVVSVPQSTSSSLLNAVLRPNLFHLLVDEPKSYQIIELALQGPMAGRQLRDIRLPGNCIVMVVRRDGEVIVPRGTTGLAAGDILTLAGDEESLREAVAVLTGNTSLPM